MVSLQTIQQSNARIASSLPAGLVALFIGATKGIGQSALQHLARHAPPSARIYSVARPGAAAAHEELLASLRRDRPDATFTLITADTSLVSEVDRAVAVFRGEVKKLDLLVLSAGFMALGARDEDTSEGLDPSMSTRYYSRLRAVQLLLPLLKAAENPRIVSVLAGGMEAPLNEADLDLRAPGAWSSWGVSRHTATMGTLALERLARSSGSGSGQNSDPNPRLSIVHWFPGTVETPGLERLRQLGGPEMRARLQNAKSQDEAGALGLFLATSARYAAAAARQQGQPQGLVPVPEGLDFAKLSGGGIFLVDAEGESVDNEEVLAEMRQRGVDEVVWDQTLKVFAACTSQGEPHDS
ncbi:hypothetical protein SLS62_007492 [Diatrype stigma]|uniref:Uncharacterized protein n=1 Tax=Diatrype stigma TaxID=117547 RepID=A0AAN9ULU6_9PEZI